jgi:hypothetical protein
MKTKATLTLLALAVFTFATAPLLRAQGGDRLHPDDITVTGKIIQGSSEDNVRIANTVVRSTGYESMPLTIANVLKVLGITGVDPKTLRYYYDSDQDAIVIAPKGIPNGGFGTPVAILLAFGKNVEFNKTAYRSVGCQDIWALDDNLHGTSFENWAFIGGKSAQNKGKLTVTNEFIAFGEGTQQEGITDAVIEGEKQTIVKGKLVHIFTNQPE